MVAQHLDNEEEQLGYAVRLSLMQVFSEPGNRHYNSISGMGNFLAQGPKGLHKLADPN